MESRTRPIGHDHETWDLKGPDLVNHLQHMHGWTDAMILRRKDTDGGTYLGRAHRSEHETASLDPSGWWRKLSPKRKHGR